MTNKQKDLIRLAEKGGNDATLLLLDRLHELEDIISEAKEDIKDLKIMFDSSPAEKRFSDEANIEKVATKLAVKLAKLEKGDKGEKGVDGYIPIKGIDYFDGQDGEDGKTPTKEELKNLIFPLIPKIDEEKMSNEVLTKTEEKLPQLGDKIRDSLELLKADERLDKKAIKGLQEALDEIKSMKGKFGGIFGPSKIYKHLTGQSFTEIPDGARVRFTLPKVTILTDTLAIFQNGTRRSLGSQKDYTITGNIVTFNTTPQVGDELLIDFEHY